MSFQAASLVTNIVLAAVTAVYVVLTWRLSRSSDKAAESAAQSAAAAADSARMQQAALEVQASQRHAWFKTGGGGNFDQFEIGVLPLLGAYWVHEVELREFQLASEVEGEDAKTIVINRAMTPTKSSLPARVDEVEGIRFEVNLAKLAREAFGHDKWRIVSWRCMVTFSLAESDQSRRRLIVHSDPSMDPRIHWLQQARELGFEA